MKSQDRYNNTKTPKPNSSAARRVPATRCKSVTGRLSDPGGMLFGGTYLNVIVVLALLSFSWFFYLSFSSMSDIAGTKSKTEELHAAAMDRMDKGPESEFGPEVIEEYSKAAKDRQERLLQLQPDFGKPGNKSKMSCGSCGKSVSSSSKVGDKCPYCRVRWTIKKIDMEVRHR